MRKKGIAKLVNWDAHYVGIFNLEKQSVIFTTFVEVVAEQIAQSLASARITTQEVAEFTSLDASDLKGNMAYLRTPYLSKHWNC
jgi:hypothetical protein